MAQPSSISLLASSGHRNAACHASHLVEGRLALQRILQVTPYLVDATCILPA